jgi:hypothetical protein
MRFKILLTLAALSLIFSVAPAQTQSSQTQTGTNRVDPSEVQPQQDQKVIDDFVGTRGVSFEDTSKKSQSSKPAGGVASGGRKSSSGGSSPRKGNSSVAQTGTKKNQTSTGKGTGKETPSGNGTGNASAGSGLSDDAQIVDAVLRPIGLGYTIFMKDSTGGLLPVDPDREYKSGERIAVVLEPNTDGYIYIFNAENDQNPLMLFPNVQLDAGANLARAHVRETYPADANYAFEFDQTAANEHIYVIVSRRPLEGVPAGDALAAFCGDNKDDCYWKPSAEQWARIKSGAAGGGVIEAKNDALLAQTAPQSVPPSSLQRGIKIKKDEPAPSVVRVNDSPKTDTLVTVIKLVHK